MLAFKLEQEQQWDADRHVEKILGKIGAGDVTVACWEPGQVSPYHCHPEATEIYFCFSGGGVMRTPEQTVDIAPGSFVVHPPGELHEYANGARRTMLFRVRYHGVADDLRSVGRIGWGDEQADVKEIGCTRGDRAWPARRILRFLLQRTDGRSGNYWSDNPAFDLN
jgi:quercetin dioxygenase-like cupin family protein